MTWTRYEIARVDMLRERATPAELTSSSTSTVKSSSSYSLEYLWMLLEVVNIEHLLRFVKIVLPLGLQLGV